MARNLKYELNAFVLFFFMFWKCMCLMQYSFDASRGAEQGNFSISQNRISTRVWQASLRSCRLDQSRDFSERTEAQTKLIGSG